MKNFNTPESCRKLRTSITSAEESIKYLLTCPQSNKDSKSVTSEYLGAIADLAYACRELYSTYQNFFFAKLWECETEEEQAEIIGNTISKLSKEYATAMLNKGMNPGDTLHNIKILFEAEM